MPTKRDPTTNLGAAQSGDRRKALEVLRDTLARTMDECDPNMHAQVAGQYRAALADLAALADPAVKPKKDELAEKRRARRSSA